MIEDDIAGMIHPASSLITELLAVRDHMHKELTAEIFELFAEQLTKAIQLYIKANREITWSSVDGLHGLPTYIRVNGTAVPSIGETLTIEGVPIQVTKENQLAFTGVLSFIIPIAMLDVPNGQDIAYFVTDLIAITGVAKDNDISTLLQGYKYSSGKRLSEEKLYTDIVDKRTRPEEILGFDTNELTDGHIKSMMLYEACGTGTGTKN